MPVIHNSSSNSNIGTSSSSSQHQTSNAHAGGGTPSATGPTAGHGTSASASGPGAIVAAGPAYMPTIAGMTCHSIGSGPAATTSAGATLAQAQQILGANALTMLVAALTSGGGAAVSGNAGGGGGTNTGSQARTPMQTLVNLASQFTTWTSTIDRFDFGVTNAMANALALHLAQAGVTNPQGGPMPLPAPATNLRPVPPMPPASAGLTSGTNHAAATPMPAEGQHLLENWVQLTTKHTGPYTYPRSTELQAVDAAVAEYSKEPTLANLQALAQTIINWQNSKGTGNAWQNSIRSDHMNQLISLIDSEQRRLIANEFTNNPHDFLNTRPFTVAGTHNGVHNYYWHPGEEGLNGLVRPAMKPYQFRPYGPDPSVQVACVAMNSTVTPTTTREQIDAMFYPIPDNVDLLTTGQLTGCVFMTRINPTTGQLECAHIQPKRPNWSDGYALEAYLKSLYGDSVTYYGRDEYTRDHQVTIVAQREDGKWMLFAQQQKVDGSIQPVHHYQTYPASAPSAAPPVMTAR